MTKKLLSILLALCLGLFMLPAFAEDSDAAEEPIFFGPFSAKDLLSEETVGPDAFGEASITLINFWATWCPNCVADLPHLAALEEMTGGKVRVIGVLLDQVASESDMPVIAMKKLMENAGAAYPTLLPDDFLQEVGTGLSFVPTTFLVDSEGNFINMVVGANTTEGWLEIAQEAAEAVYGEDFSLVEDV